MREMKNSGIEWIGVIPKDWKISRFKYQHNGSNVGESIDKDFWSNDINDYLFYTAGLKPINTTFDSFPEWKRVGKSDLLLARNGTPYVYLPFEGAFYSDHIIRVKLNRNFNKVFLSYCLQRSIESVVVDVVSIATWSVSLWNEQYITFPPIDEQKRIADFLDDKCSEIDALTADIQSEIETLEAYKRSVITEAVTKGLDKNVPMKDSQVEWIGDIPSHWKVTPFRAYVTERTEKNKYKQTTELLALSFALGITLYKDKIYNKDRVKDNFEEYNVVHKNDLVLSPNDIIKGSIFVSKYDGCISPMYYIFSARNAETHNLYYLSYLLRTKEAGRRFFYIARGLIGSILENGKYVTRRMTVSRQDLLTFKVLLPPYKEQKEIVEYLDKKCSEIDSIIADKRKQLTILNEYKKSVIYEYVTGKKEVV